MDHRDRLSRTLSDDNGHEAPPAGFLARIASATGSSAGSAIAQHAGDGESSTTAAARWDESFELAGRGIGVRTQFAEISVREVAESVRPTTVHVCWSAQAGWLAVAAGEGRELRLIRAREADASVTQAEIAAILELEDVDTARPWCIAEPSLAAATSPDGHRLPPFRRLVEILRPDRGDLITVVLYAVFIGLLTLATPIAVQQLVNTVAFGGLVQPVVVLAILLFLGLAFAGLLTGVQTYLAEIIQRRVFVRACVDLADRLPRVRADGFGTRHGPEVVNRFFDLVTLQKVGASLMLGGTALVLQTISGLIILSFYHPVMFGFSLLLIGSIAFVVVVLGRGATTTAISESAAKYELGAWMEELARHPSAFRTRSGRHHAMVRADELAAAWVDARSRHFRIVMRQIIAALGLQVGVGTLVLALGGVLVVAGQLTLGQLVASEIIVGAVVAAFARFGKMLENYYDLLAAVDKIGVLLDLPLEREGGDSASASEAPATITVEKVELQRNGRSFSGPLWLSIQKGERVGLCGPNGSGKSQFLDLLCGSKTPQRGSIRLDGQDYADLRLESIADQVMLLRQNEIVAGSLADNVRVARPEASMGEVREALRRVGLAEVAQDLPDGLHSALSPDGAPLGASQIRLLMLARAVLARPRLLLLDEAFLGLDDATRARAMDAVLHEGAPWSVLVVSHSRDVLDRCDRVVSISDLQSAPAPVAPAHMDANEEATR